MTFYYILSPINTATPSTIHVDGTLNVLKEVEDDVWKNPNVNVNTLKWGSDL